MSSGRLALPMQGRRSTHEWQRSLKERTIRKEGSLREPRSIYCRALCLLSSCISRLSSHLACAAAAAYAVDVSNTRHLVDLAGRFVGDGGRELQYNKYGFEFLSGDRGDDQCRWRVHDYRPHAQDV